MKKLILILILFNSVFITEYSFSQSGWYWQNPKPQGNDLMSISFLNSITGFAVGKYGSIIKTTNEGENWFPIYLPITQSYLKIKFSDINTGFILSNDFSLLKTSNGGNSWGILSIPADSIINFSFYNSNKGIIISNHLVYKTSNGGSNWVTLLSLSSNEYLKNSIYINDSIIYLVGYKIIPIYPNPYSVGIFYSTTNNGVTWNYQNTSSYGNGLIYFYNSLTGFIGSYTYILKTNNGGNNWQSIFVSNNSNNFLNINFLNEQTGFLTSSNSSIYDSTFKTINGGNTWTIFSNSYIDFDFPDNNTVVGIGKKGKISKSTNNGMNFVDKKTSVTSQKLTTIHCVSDSVYYAAGLNGVIIKTTNFGKDWFNQQSGITNHFTNIRFINNDNGTAVGNRYIIHTSNGGSNWIIQKYDSTKIYEDVFFIDINTGFVSGRDGIFLKTTNSGTNWERIYLDSMLYYESIYFINSQTGFVYGNNSTGILRPNIFKTTNRGLNWTGYYGQRDGMAIYFINDMTGITAGFEGHIYRTSNGGVNWDSCNTVTNEWLQSIAFINENTGFIVSGHFSEMLKTTNSGINWFLLNPFLDMDDGLWGISSYNGVAVFVGDYGIIKSTRFTNYVRINHTNQLIPNNFFLSQNYPNPFNPSTNIIYQIANNCFVTLKVYDILGKEIATLVNDKLSPGTYSVDWNASQYPSGVYFYKLDTEGFSQTKKMILLK